MYPINIPLDLQINVLLRLPVKSLFRFRCVSKLWSSIITSRDFRKWHLNIASSSLPPRLLIAFQDILEDNILVVSVPNPNALEYYSSSSSSYRDLILVNVKGRKVYNAGQGLICVSSDFANVRICNPTTRQVHNFPECRFKHSIQFFRRREYICGYDPVEDQYKVLAVSSWPPCVLGGIGRRRRLEHKVLVLGGEEAWREAPCVACPHIVCTRGLDMNGTVYYGAYRTDIESPHNSIIVSFNVRLETFNIIKVPSIVVPMGYKNMWNDVPFRTDKTLISYQGTIGVVEDPREGSFRMWVLQDAEKAKWSMNTFSLPESAASLNFKVMDTFSTGEICLVRKEWSDPFCLFYYNLEKKSMRNVTIEGLPISDFKQAIALSVSVFDHYESFMFL